MQPATWSKLADQIEQLEALDDVAGRLQEAVAKAVPAKTQRKDLLSGTWLGHPAHPPLTDVVVGAWSGALLLDLLGGDRSKDAADQLVGIGILAALPTAATGLSDWADLRGGDRRIGLVHALGNVTALALHGLSWSARRRGARGSGKTLSALGYGIAAASAWLGGHLAFNRGVGVDRTAFERGPSEWTPVCAEMELAEGRLAGASANDTALLLVRLGGVVHALADTCSHRGCALHEGELRGETVVCACHGSAFRIGDGSIAKGPATAPQPVYETRARDGKIEVRA